jgi:hypothetical protein
LVDRFPITLEKFADSVQGMEVNPVVVDGQIAGALIVSGHEIHACILPQFKGRWLSRKELRIMNAVIEKHGYAQTSATTEEGETFVKRLGFVQHGNTFRRLQSWA